MIRPFLPANQTIFYVQVHRKVTLHPQIKVRQLNVKARDLREAQEQSRSPNEEGCRRRYRHIATGTKVAGRGGVSESPTHTETRRHWGENRQLKADWRGQKTSVRHPLVELQEESTVIVKVAYYIGASAENNSYNLYLKHFINYMLKWKKKSFKKVRVSRIIL